MGSQDLVVHLEHEDLQDRLAPLASLDLVGHREQLDVPVDLEVLDLRDRLV